MTDLRHQAITAPPVGRRTTFPAALAAVYTAQLSRARVARGPLLFVATLQSLGIVILLRGVVHGHDATTASAVVAGSTVLVMAFVGLNLLAQRFGALRATSALDYYAALPIPVSAVVLGTAACYATFAVPGALLTAVIGAAIYGLSFAHLWLAVPAIIVAGVALSGVGAFLGLVLPRPELATVAGQLAMTAVLFVGVIPPEHLPGSVRWLREVLPSTYEIDGLSAALRGNPTWAGESWRLLAGLGYGAVALALAAWAFRRAVER